MTTHAKHTPGPWVAATGKFAWGKAPVVMSVTPHSKNMICTLSHESKLDDDAALIAAAPAMYDALQFVREFYQTHFDVMPVAFQTVDNICTTALSQAEGGDHE